MSRAHSYSHSRAHSPSFPSLHLRHNSFSNPSLALPTSQLILQPFRCFTYVTTHSPTLPLLYLHHSSFSNPSLALPTSQLILQLYPCFTYVTAHSPTLPLLHLRHSSFSNPSFASMSQDFHLRRLASRPWVSRIGGSVMQAVRPRLPPLWSRVRVSDNSMWVSWWTERSLDSFFFFFF